MLLSNLKFLIALGLCSLAKLLSIKGIHMLTLPNKQKVNSKTLRTIFRNALRANEHDAVIFVGNGVTSAVHKLISALDLSSVPVVFVGPFEHHSNLLPWREIAAYVIPISESSDGSVNEEHLEFALREWSKYKVQMIGCFSAASNITGVVTDTIKISTILHKYGALAFWDYATGGAYLDIDMHPHSSEDANKDAIFLSMHKFIGGVDAPGVLVARRSLFVNNIPSGAGGGSVFFVGRNNHRYLQDEEMREEGGTPRVVGIVRAALALELKQTIGTSLIMQKEEQYYVKAMETWKDCSNLHMLGNCNTQLSTGHRLALFSFMIFHPSSKLYLHHNFVATLLNDVFGIQSRGGCACAGPYAQELLGIDEDTADEFEKALLEDNRLDRAHLRRKTEYSQHEVLRPGFVRLNLAYFATLDEVDYVIRAVAMVAKHGWRCLPSYKFNPETGEWRYIKHKMFADRLWLGHAKFTQHGLVVGDGRKKLQASHDFDELLKMGEEIFKSHPKSINTASLSDHSLMFDEKVEHLRWFLLPSEALAYLNNKPVTCLARKCAVSVRRDIKQLSKEEILQRIKIPSNVSDILRNIGKKIVNLKIIPSTNNEKLNSISSNTPPGVIPSVCVLKPRNQLNSSPAHKTSTFVAPPKRLFKLTTEAIEEFDMITNSDKVLVCLSGGKDSLSLLHVLHQYQYYAKSKGISFELGAVTVDPMTSSYDPSPLIPYLESLGVTYFYEKQDIVGEAMRTCVSSICAFCSRMKRGRIYACARREGWNILAFGQHLDDLAESFLMSAFHNGLLRTMKANYVVKEGDLRVIRPFVYVRETDTRQFAESAKLPVIPENCPACFEAPKERHRIKQLLASQEILHPRLFPSLKEAIHPLMAKNRTGMESKHRTVQLEEDE